MIRWKYVFFIIIEIIAVLIGLASLATWVFATYLLADTGYLMGGYSLFKDEDFEEITSDPDLDLITQKYLGIDAQDIDEYLSKESEASIGPIRYYANMWSRRTAINVYHSDHEKFLKRYESIIKTISKIGVPCYNWILTIGYLGITFLAVLYFILFVYVPDQLEGSDGAGTWYIFGDGSIGKIGDSHLLAGFLMIVAGLILDLLLAPILNLVLSIAMIGIGIYKIACNIGDLWD